LIAYFAHPSRGEPHDDDGRVIVFIGEAAGTGFDGEPLVVPTSVVEVMSWSRFLTRERARDQPRGDAARAGHPRHR
jgi:hypothetical protein